jgi:hypothetical protein
LSPVSIEQTSATWRQQNGKCKPQCSCHHSIYENDTQAVDSRKKDEFVCSDILTFYHFF